MYVRSTSICAVAMAMAVAMTLGTVSTASAQQPPASTASTFLANPSQILQQFPKGGPEMETRIRELAVSDPATLQVILNLLATANKDQKSAIGAGLAQAAKIVVRTNPAYANQIQQAVTQTKDQDAVLAFTSVIGDIQLGGVGGGPGGGGGAIGGQTNPLIAGATGASGIQGIPGNGVNTGPFAITSSVSGGGGSITNASTPVSP
jgi:hypothetical protein